MFTDNITIDYLLKSRNVNNEIYECDIKRIFGWDLNRSRLLELKRILTQLSEKINDTR